MTILPDDDFSNDADGSLISIIIACIIIFMGGCSAKERISEAASRVHSHAVSADGHLDSALATGEVGTRAAPHVHDAKGDLAEIKTHAAAVTQALPGVKDVESGFWSFLRSAFWIIIAGAIVFAAIYFAPVAKPLLHMLGAWLNWIPRPIVIDARSDAELIANAKAGKVKPTRMQIAAIEAKKRDPRWRKAHEQALNAENAKRAGA